MEDDEHKYSINKEESIPAAAWGPNAEFSGIQLPAPEKEKIEISIPEKQPDIKLDSYQFRKLRMFLMDEEETNKAAEAAIRKADKAKEKRDKYCLELEKLYNIAGYKWTVDLKVGSLILGEKRA